MSENARLTKAAGIVGFATLLSRIFGFVRDVVIAWHFGAGLGSDAFFVAFRIPNLLRRLFAEGSLSIAFVPVFTEYIKEWGTEEAFRFARSAIRLLSVLLAFTAVAGILLSPIIVRVIAPGFAEFPDKLNLTITLTRLMFPYVILICLVALCGGILNVLGHFSAPALAPVFLNIAMIGSVFLISPRLTQPAMGLAMGVLLGGMLQLALQIPFLIQNRFLFWKKADFYHPGLKRVGALMLPAVFGAAVYQINILVGTLLASLLPEGSVSYLYYADRLVQFPLGIFAVAAATAVLPSLSRQAAEKDFHAMKGTFAYAFNFVLFITIPAMVGLIVLREPIVALLFKRGAFDHETTRMTADALLYYGVGLWAFSAVRIVLSTFYALQDTVTPVKIASVSIVANIIFGIILMQWMAHGGLALATSLASMVNLVFLIRALKGKMGTLDWRNISASACKTLISSVIMGVGVGFTGMHLIPGGQGSSVGLLFGLTGSIFSGLILYGCCSRILKSPELESILGMIRKGVKRAKAWG